LIDPAHLNIGDLTDDFNVFLDIEIETSFSATGYHIFWTHVFTVIITILGLVFLTILAFYFRLNWVYQECEIAKKKGDKL